MLNGWNLKRIRMSNNISIYALSKYTGLHKSYITQVENCTRTNTISQESLIDLINSVYKMRNEKDSK